MREGKYPGIKAFVKGCLLVLAFVGVVAMDWTYYDRSPIEVAFAIANHDYSDWLIVCSSVLFLAFAATKTRQIVQALTSN